LYSVKAPHADVPRADRGENLLYSVKAPGKAGREEARPLGGGAAGGRASPCAEVVTSARP
jgi:hypothetical protein